MARFELALFSKFRKPFLLLITFVGVIFFGIALYVNSLHQRLVHSSAIENAQRYAEILTEFRSLYTSKVVTPLAASEVQFSHNYSYQHQVIPLPATFTLLLGESLNNNHLDVRIRLFSPYPYPWRKNEGGIIDSFGQDAWDQLSKDKSKIITNIEDIDGRSYVRLAMADVMRTDCLFCHNTHPKTPKGDWQAGDLRGVLEVTMPIDEVAVANSIFFNMGILGVMLLIVMLIGGGYMILLRNKNQLEKAKNKELLKQYKESQKMADLGAMVASITHEMATPLGNINLALDHHLLNTEEIIAAVASNTLKHIQLKRYLDDSESTISMCLSNNARASKLITSFKHIAVNQCNRQQITINLANYINDILLTNKPTIKKYKHQVVVSVAKSIELTCMAGALAQVITNLVNNALIHAFDKSDGGIINIIAWQEPRRVFIEVSDNGKGMDRVQQGNAFDEYYTTKLGQGGSGLGLFICREIVKNELGGNITLDSELGQGATFTLSIENLMDTE